MTGLQEIDTPGQLDGWDKKEYSKKAKVKEQLVKTLVSSLSISLLLSSILHLFGLF
jgi:hypothetical protein